MNTRIKEVRKAKNLTQEAFAERIGIKRNSVAQIESGARVPSNQVVISISREFGINENWLRTGEGSMEDNTRSDFELITRAMTGTSEGKKKLMRLIADMPDDLLDKMLEYLESKK